MFYIFSLNILLTVLPLDEKNLDLFLTRELSVFLLECNFWININFPTHSLRSPFNSSKLLFRVGTNFWLNKSNWFLFNFYVDRLMFDVLFCWSSSLCYLVILLGFCCLKKVLPLVKEKINSYNYKHTRKYGASL